MITIDQNYHQQKKHKGNKTFDLKPPSWFQIGETEWYIDYRILSFLKINKMNCYYVNILENSVR